MDIGVKNQNQKLEIQGMKTESNYMGGYRFILRGILVVDKHI